MQRERVQSERVQGDRAQREATCSSLTPSGASAKAPSATYASASCGCKVIARRAASSAASSEAPVFSRCTACIETRRPTTRGYARVRAEWIANTTRSVCISKNAGVTFLCRFFHCRRVVCACSAGAVGSFSNKPLSTKISIVPVFTRFTHSDPGSDHNAGCRATCRLKPPFRRDGVATNPLTTVK